MAPALQHNGSNLLAGGELVRVNVAVLVGLPYFRILVVGALRPSPVVDG